MAGTASSAEFSIWVVLQEGLSLKPTVENESINEFDSRTIQKASFILYLRLKNA